MKNDIACCRIDVDSGLIESAQKHLHQLETHTQLQAKLFSLLGNSVRLKIVTLFLEYERMCVCDLSDVLEMKQSPISQHLRKLKDGGILQNKREGMTIYYFLASNMQEEIKKILQG